MRCKIQRAPRSERQPQHAAVWSGRHGLAAEPTIAAAHWAALDLTQKHGCMQGIEIQANPDADCGRDDDKPPDFFATGSYFGRGYFFWWRRFWYFMFLTRFSHRCIKVIGVHRLRIRRFGVQSSPFRVTLLWLTLKEQGSPLIKAKTIHPGLNFQTQLLLRRNIITRIRFLPGGIPSTEEYRSVRLKGN